MSMRLVVVSLVVVAGCAQEVVELGETQAAITPVGGQGTDYNGTDYNGTDYNGTDYNGTDYNGTDYNHAGYGGTALTDNVTVTGTELMIWRRNGFNWEQRFPNRICYWNATRTILDHCTTVTLFNTPSPLAGASFTGHFTNPITGVTITGTLYIADRSTSRVGGVVQDTSAAMHPLSGASSAAIIYPPQADGENAKCTNPKGCRVNSEIWLYTVKLWDPTTATLLDFCKDGKPATALAGVWDGTGQHTDDGKQFTFACTNGTIAKCTRWGYRPYASARACAPLTCTRTDPLIPLADYHQACVRAATADYCANGHSFTKNGTIVDIWDDTFVPRTRSGLLSSTEATGVLWESTFDKGGAVVFDHQRYQELAALGDSVDNACPGRFYPTSGDALGCQSTSHTCEVRNGSMTPPYVYIDSSTACSHSEGIVGKWLDHGCSICTGSVPDHCNDPADSRGWDLECTTAAGSCTATHRMAVHDECTVGPKLDLYDSGCTLAVCLDPATASCCTSSWTSACTAAAESKCKFAKNASNAGSSLLGYCTWAATHGGISP